MEAKVYKDEELLDLLNTAFGLDFGGVSVDEREHAVLELHRELCRLRNLVEALQVGPNDEPIAIPKTGEMSFKLCKPEPMRFEASQEPQEPDCDYRALYEKERERWKKLKVELLKMKGDYREELQFMSQNNEAREMPETKRVMLKRVMLNVVLQKMKELEEG